MNLEPNNQPPEFTKAILAKEDVAFKAKSSKAVDPKTINLIFFAFLGLIAIFASTLIMGASETISQLIQNRNFSILDTKTLVILIGSVTVIGIILGVILKQLHSIFNNKNSSLWFIGTNNFLLVASDTESIPIAWHYLSDQIKVTSNSKNIGNVIIKYARKEYALGADNPFPQIYNTATISMIQIQNPVQITEICKTKIRQSGTKKEA